MTLNLDNKPHCLEDTTRLLEDFYNEDNMALGKIGNRFQLLEQLGTGGYGTVFKAYDEATKSTVALKVDHEEDQTEGREEAEKYKVLHGVEGLPKVIISGTHEKKHYIAMELLGEDLWEACRYSKLSQKDVFLVAIKCLNILEKIHTKGILHCDIKPENIMTGKLDKKQYFLMDFGLATFYMDENGKHKDMVKASPRGSPDFASLNCHKKTSLSRRDDLESLAYTLLFILNGELPWSNTWYSHYEMSRLSPKEMFKNHSPVFAAYLEYCRNLNFEEKPDYLFLIKLFQDEAKRKYPFINFSFSGF